MFAKVFTFFALVAVAFAAAKPEPTPQVYYTPGVDVAYSGVVPAYSGYSAYSAPLAYSAYSAPLAYSAYPGAYYYR